MLRAREVGMLKEDRINRMLEAPLADDAAKLLVDCGYPDMSSMGMAEIEGVLQKRRQDVFHEISNYGYALDLLDLFRVKYDYHNLKALVKSSGANIDASHLISDCGRVDAKELCDAFDTGNRAELPPPIAAAMETSVGILSRTGNPQLADIEIDKAYFSELSSIACRIGDEFISGYVRLLIDTANIRITVRTVRTGRDADFLSGALIPGGDVGIELIVTAFDDDALAPFTADALVSAVRLGAEAMDGGSQTRFELECDNVALFYVTNTMYISFGAAPVVAYLSKLEWEITAVRMILTGKLTGIPPEVIRERLRECHV